jgi:hypothetical protein
MITGIIGLISGFRKSYSLIYSFYSSALISMFVLIFLIVNYSIIIQYYYRFKSNLNPNAEIFRPSNRPDSADASFGIVATNLAISILTCLVAFFGVVVSFVAGEICIHPKIYSDSYGNIAN